MLNVCVLMGRITHTPELKTTKDSNKSVMRFSIAVNRGNKEKETDFFSCVAWEKNAEFINKYFKKGDPIIVNGRLQIRNYKGKDGTDKTITEVVVYEVNFCAFAKDKNQSTNDKSEDEITCDDDLPF